VSAGSYTDSGCCMAGLEETTLDEITVCCAEGEEAFCTKFENGECVAGACCATAEDGKTIRWSQDEVEPDVCETIQTCDEAHQLDENGECTRCAEGWHAIARLGAHFRCFRPKGYHCPARCVRNTCSKTYYTLCDEEQCEELGDHFVYGEDGCGCIEGYTGHQCNSCADRYYKDGNGNCELDPDCTEPNATFTCFSRVDDGSCDSYVCCPQGEQAYCYTWASEASAPDVLWCDDARCCAGTVLAGQGLRGSDVCVDYCPEGQQGYCEERDVEADFCEVTNCCAGAVLKGQGEDGADACTDIPLLTDDEKNNL